MRSLPPFLVDVDVPEYFSPSSLGAATSCPLKFVTSAARSHPDIEKLASGPEAALGTLAHRVFERIGKGEPARDAERVFDAEYRRLSLELSTDERRRHFSDLAATKPPGEWARFRARVIAQCVRLGGHHPARSTGSSADRISGTAVPVGAEKPLESRALRLRGVADWIGWRAADTLEIRDYKTGNVLDDDGAVKPSIALQLLAYGVILAELEPTVHIRLIVDAGSEHEVPFDGSARREAKDLLEGIISALPAPGPIRATAIARSGEACFGCRVRHVCPAYRAAAPSWFREYPQGVERTPNDTWGTIVQVRQGERLDLVLIDEAGRRVRVDAIDRRHGEVATLQGQPVWMFELESSGPTFGFDGARYCPRAFHELPRDRRERRAWRAEFFRGVLA